jgi:hypothetical protein
VVLVTGQPAGFAEAWARTLPVFGVIAENGGVSVRLDAAGAPQVYARPDAAVSGTAPARPGGAGGLARGAGRAHVHRQSLHRGGSAIDVNEEVRLGPEAAQRWRRSSPPAESTPSAPASSHAAWIGPFNKAWMVRRFIRSVWKERLRPTTAGTSASVTA